MLFRAVLLIVLLAVCVAPNPGAAQKPVPAAPSMKPLHPEWHKIHKAGIIVVGTLVSRAEDPASQNGADRGKAFQKPVLLEIRDAQIVKGDPLPAADASPLVRARYNLSQATSQQERELKTLQALQNRPVLVFAQSGNPFAEPSAILEIDAFAVVAARPDDARIIRAELENQAAIKAWFPTSSLSKAKPGDPWEKTVTRGLDRMVRDAQIDRTAEIPVDDAQKRLQARVEDIENWGPKSYPALIRHLSDRRKLPYLQVGYKTPPYFWESRYYAHPETVMDVIDSVLTFSIKADLTSIDLRGANDSQRLAVTQALWVYLVYSHDATSTASDK